MNWVKTVDRSFLYETVIAFYEILDALLCRHYTYWCCGVAFMCHNNHIKKREKEYFWTKDIHIKKRRRYEEEKKNIITIFHLCWCWIYADTYLIWMQLFCTLYFYYFFFLSYKIFFPFLLPHFFFACSRFFSFFLSKDCVIILKGKMCTFLHARATLCNINLIKNVSLWIIKICRILWTFFSVKFFFVAISSLSFSQIACEWHVYVWCACVCVFQVSMKPSNKKNCLCVYHHEFWV